MNSTLYSHSLSHGIAQQHFNNISASLAHRIEVARANNDRDLLSQLQQEQNLLESPYGVGSTTKAHGLKKFWQQVVTAIQNADQLTVEKIVDESGETWWYAHDPRTAKTLWADTQTEIVKWIEDNNLGQ
ncbi:MAG: hypothetical protein WBA57_03520 [Elainellaceae cyanobacterium]